MVLLVRPLNALNKSASADFVSIPNARLSSCQYNGLLYSKLIRPLLMAYPLLPWWRD